MIFVVAKEIVFFIQHDLQTIKMGCVTYKRKLQQSTCLQSIFLYLTSILCGKDICLKEILTGRRLELLKSKLFQALFLTSLVVLVHDTREHAVFHSNSSQDLTFLNESH